MAEMVTARKRRSVRRWLKSTSRRTFFLYPVIVVAAELIIGHGEIRPSIWGAPLLLWGYLQYRLAGAYRTRIGGGGPGLEVPPERIVASGVYRYTRNPMYLGHMIFMLGLAITFSSWLAVALLIFHVFWFNARAREDEDHLEEVFGPPYNAYKARVKRWIPGVV
jgi:protein-S-isoprenylcysteine O-methyltransferase Ste14